VFAALIFFAGCAAPGDGPPPMLRAAAVQTRAGEEAYLAGRAADAVPALAEAVRLHLAAGDLPGAARALLNLALAERAAGDTGAAAATAMRLRDLTPPALQQARQQGAPAESLAGISAGSVWLDVLLALERGDTAAAGALLNAVGEKFPGSSPWPGRLETARAQLALAEGRFAAALTHARAGGAACAAAGDRAEEARARRLAGAARVRLDQWNEARADFLAALKLEESLGGGARMAGDLRQLSAIAEHQGDSAEAQLYSQRAAVIAAALGR